MRKSILILANNNSWTSWPAKVAGIQSFWAPFVDMSVKVQNTYFKNIPLSPVSVSDGGSGGGIRPDNITTSYIVNKDWYQKNIDPLAAGYDFVIFCLSPKDFTQTLVPAGVYTGRFGTINNITIFGGQESWHSYMGGNDLGDSFTLFANHEISHGFYQMFCLLDNTHKYFYSGRPTGIFNDLSPSKLQIKIESISSALANLVKQINPVNNQTTNSVLLYNTAKSCLGTSLVPAGNDPELGCAASVNELWKRIKGVPIGGGASTYNLLQALLSNPAFKEVTSPLPGDIIISATGTSTAPSQVVSHGHVGVVAKYGILSNDSANGRWSENYIMDTWKARYEKIGGYPTRFFRPL